MPSHFIMGPGTAAASLLKLSLILWRPESGITQIQTLLAQAGSDQRWETTTL